MPLLCVLLSLGGCRAAPQPVPEPAAPPPEPVAPPAPVAEPKTPVADETTTTAVLRSHLLQLLPCGGAEGEMDVTVTVARDGGLGALRAEWSGLSGEMARCALARLAWWRFPVPAGGEPMDLRFHLSWPLRPPSIYDHAAVSVPGTGRIDLTGVAQEMRRLRERVIACLAPGPAGRPRMVLLAVRLGEWGKLLDVGVEADTAAPALAQQDRERACLLRAARQGHFPNPESEADLRFPYVVVP